MIRQVAALPNDAVRECASGEDAVCLAREFSPDVITMDARLPGLSGFVATAAICASHPSIKVVMVSAYDQPELRRAAQSAGAVGYIVKDDLSSLRPLLSPDRAKAQPSVASPESGPHERIG